MTKAIIEQLVDAMNKHGSPYLGHIEEYQAALIAAREYLAQPNTQEPVAYEFRMRADWVPDWGLWSPCNKEQHEMYLRVPKLHDWIYETRALYTHPAPQAKPLTDEQIDEIWLAVSEAYDETGLGYESHNFARAVEQAHGIGVKP